MNVALTYFCNQKCPYCFGTDAMKAGKARASASQMTAGNLSKVMAFMKKSNVERFNMIGGEPTLHSRFEDFFEAIVENGFSVMIFSNGVIERQRVDFMSGQDKLESILLNIREPWEYRARDFKMIEYALSRLSKKVVLSFRIYRLDFDPGFLFDLVDKYNLRRLINWAIACPSLAADNAYLRLEDHEKAVSRMVKFSRISKKRGINWYPDSGFILCAFSAGQLEELQKNVDFSPITNCSAAMEVAPDLRIFRCYGMAPKSRPGFKITDFDNLAQAEEYFFKKSLPFKRIGALDKCFKCEHILSHRCGGGCMVHILKKLPQHRSPIF